MHTYPPVEQDICDVLIIGSGPTGLTLACDLARRGINVRIIEKAAAPFNGSRGKGIQPRTLEVFDSLGVAAPLLRAGQLYPPMKFHVSFLSIKWNMMKYQKQAANIPYPNAWLVPQWRTEQVLRDRLAELDIQVEWATEACDIKQNAEGVTVQLDCRGQTCTVHARYLVGADGGKSFVRKQLGVNFAGATSQEGRMIVGDLEVDGLSRDAWHIWPMRKGAMIGLCPMPHSNLFQLMMRLDADEPVPELSEHTLQTRWLAATGQKKIRLHSPRWLSVFRPNVRLAERYRVERVFLAGDAAHVHTPAGAQGLNTGVQDAWNLGWKLAAVLGGAPEALLDTYEEERRPVAAAVLELSSELFNNTTGAGIPRFRRGDKERQLLLNYRGRSLSLNSTDNVDGKVQAGDRAPDATCSQQRCGSTQLFDVFRGGHFTLLAFGAHAIAATQAFDSHDKHCLRTFAVRPKHIGDDRDGLVDEAGQACEAYGVSAEENVIFLVRPDGYVGLVAVGDFVAAIKRYLARVTGAPGQITGRDMQTTRAIAH
ncbi:FAD-dependent oxidoreductase [Pseudomonas syringae]|uniref:FAD-dependent oxidoreductase n=1 Tax=Pseudomonas syringae TaxID=317 RepID=UPI003F769C72